MVSGDAQQCDSIVGLHLIPPGTAEQISEKEHHSWKLPFTAMPLAVSVWDSKMLQILFRPCENISTDSWSTTECCLICI